MSQQHPGPPLAVPAVGYFLWKLFGSFPGGPAAETVGAVLACVLGLVLLLTVVVAVFSIVASVFGFIRDLLH